MPLYNTKESYFQVYFTAGTYLCYLQNAVKAGFPRYTGRFCIQLPLALISVELSFCPHPKGAACTLY
jgi:hypothetical protein